MKCEACERGDHDNCGMQTWCNCNCDCEGYSADVNWLMDEHGFDYSTCGTALVKSLGGGWEVVCGVKECRGEVEVRSSAIHYVYHGPPKIEPSYVLETNPTRESIRRLLSALGVEPKGAKT